MTNSIVSDVINIRKDWSDIEESLSDVCGGEIIRWAIVEVSEEFYKISFSYKK